MKYIYIILAAYTAAISTTPLYFCTATNDMYFAQLINLIACIHKYNFDELAEIAVFDLGMTTEQRTNLKTVQKVSIHDVELTHPDLLKPVKTRTWGKPVPGWYAWKPVIIKQALDLFPYILYIDAGTTLYGPLDYLFLYITEHNYFFHNGSPWCVNQEATQHVIKKFNLESPYNHWILHPTTRGLEAGLMGLTRAMLQDFVLPMYELTKDLRNFEDDGTASGAFGNSRHDLTLFSILALQKNYTIHQHVNNPQEPCLLPTTHGLFSLHIACNKEDLQKETAIYCSRSDLSELDKNCPYIRLK
ncbi:MAG: hypothetical protein WC707_04080 [Candidatus Babeliaceae bacterium]|jgi:hypothetical protein